MGERDAIADSDQGKSFRTFWDFLMSQSRQEELSLHLEVVLALPPIRAGAPDYQGIYRCPMAGRFSLATS